MIPRASILLYVCAALLGALAFPMAVTSSDQRWRDTSLSPELRARAALQAMTFDEKLSLVHTNYGLEYDQTHPKPNGAIGSAGFAPGVPRLGIPAQQETDAGLGIANPGGIPALDQVTPLPSGLAIGATFDPSLAFAAGAMIGAEARAHGFNILLAGGANLARDARGGRNFEYIGEDPLLTGRLAGATIAGIESRKVISTLKHFALNDQETGRVVLSADISDRDARESDLLAFELALEAGHPGAVMTGYNRVNGTYASQNAGLIDDVLKRDWHYAGWVMSDWGAVHATVPAVLAGLDQESGQEFDREPYFDAPLRAALASGAVPASRLEDMALRVLRSNFAAGIVDDPPRPGGSLDREADAAVAKTVEQNAIVLLQNRGGTLPLGSALRRIVVVGAHADRGVLSGGGSSQVTPVGAFALDKEQPYHVTSGLKFYDPSSPLEAIRRLAPTAQVDFVAGNDHAAAAAAARGADAVVLFAEQWNAESRDAPDLRLPSEQDTLIAAVAAANAKTIVVLETGDPVAMPWLADVPAVIEAWYPGARGGETIADVLFGKVDPSGRLPMTFPRNAGQLPRPTERDAATTRGNPGGPETAAFDVDYRIEGADVGYKWALRNGLSPLFPFGFGLSYTRFSYDALEARTEGDRIIASIDVANVGTRPGTDTPQLYVEDEAHTFTRRLAGFARVALEPGERRRVTMVVDPRLVARFDEAPHCWMIAPGRYLVSARPDALAAGRVAAVTLPAATLAP